MLQFWTGSSSGASDFHVNILIALKNEVQSWFQNDLTSSSFLFPNDVIETYQIVKENDLRQISAVDRIAENKRSWRILLQIVKKIISRNSAARSKPNWMKRIRGDKLGTDSPKPTSM
jgi:hypothetical protein